MSKSNLDLDVLLNTFAEELITRERERANPQLSGQNLEKPLKVDPQCSCCQQSHHSTSCSSVTNPADSKQILKTSGRCFNCLCQSHVSHNCKSLSRFQRCNKKHHTSICDAGLSPSSLWPCESGLNSKARLFQSTRTTSTFCSGNLQTMLLQIACAMIHHPCDSHVSLKIRLVLDGGSQESYINECAHELLNLSPFPFRRSVPVPTRRVQGHVQL